MKLLLPLLLLNFHASGYRPEPVPPKTTLYYNEDLFVRKAPCAKRLADFEMTTLTPQDGPGYTRHFLESKSGLHFYTQAFEMGETVGHDHFVYFNYIPVSGGEPNYSIVMKADSLCSAFGFSYGEYNGNIAKFTVVIHFANEEDRLVYVLTTDKNPQSGDFKFFGIKTDKNIESVEVLQTGHSYLILNDVRF